MWFTLKVDVIIIFPPTTIVEIDNIISIKGLDFVPF